jgi:hypothetical protein
VSAAVPAGPLESAPGGFVPAEERSAFLAGVMDGVKAGCPGPEGRRLAGRAGHVDGADDRGVDPALTSRGTTSTGARAASFAWSTLTARQRGSAASCRKRPAPASLTPGSGWCSISCRSLATHPKITAVGMPRRASARELDWALHLTGRIHQLQDALADGT